MGHSTVSISIVTPMHNEELCVEEFCRRVATTLQSLRRSFEIIIISDGSTDGTEARLRQLCLRYEALRPIFLQRNVGQCQAMYAGLQHSRGRFVVVMDGDLQHAPEEIPLLIEQIDKGYDLVSGSRVNRSESLLVRRLPSAVANWLLRTTTGCEIRDMGGFKCMRGEIARSLHLRAGQHRLLPAIVHLQGGSVSEVAVSAPPRLAGHSHYGIARSLDVFFDILMLWFQASFKSRPLYMFGRLSLALMVLAIILFAWLFYDKLVENEPMAQRPPFFAMLVIFIASLGFMAIGFILEILSNVLQVVANIKPYIVREMHEPRHRHEGSPVEQGVEDQDDIDATTAEDAASGITIVARPPRPPRE